MKDHSSTDGPYEALDTGPVAAAVRPKDATDCGHGPGGACHMCHNGPLAGQSHLSEVVDFGDLLVAQFPRRDLVEASAALPTRRDPWDGGESHRPDGTGSPPRRSYIRVSPGSIQVLRRDVNRQEKSLARARDSHEAAAAEEDARLRDALADWQEASAQEYLHTEDLAGLPDFDPDWERPPQERARISEWSAKSRANMVRKYAQIDYHPMLSRLGMPAMVTLTYPGCDPAAVEADRAARRAPGGLWSPMTPQSSAT